jgi:hypothetical protein
MSAERWEAACLREMLELAAGRVSDRKLDLFNLWCCHSLRPYLRDRRSLAAVRFVEQHVDEGSLDATEREAIRQAAHQAFQELNRWAHSAPRTPTEYRNRRVYVQVAKVALEAVGNDLPSRGVHTTSQFAAYAYAWANDDAPDIYPDESPSCEALKKDHFRLQDAVFRDIVGNPFRAVEFDPFWRTSDVLGLARAVYEDGVFDRMPILADALMDAGCADEAIIGHCRGPGPHVHGCWVVDLVLGKS